jgi:hypothetical protein
LPEFSVPTLRIPAWRAPRFVLSPNPSIAETLTIANRPT